MDPDADVGRTGRTYILGCKVHLTYVEGNVPYPSQSNPSRNNK